VIIPEGTRRRLAPITPVDVIVLGGGIAGLAAARALAKARLRVILLEARPRLGGRIYTRRPPGWPIPVELGAEFIHGGNRDLWKLVEASKAKPRRLPDRHWLASGAAITRIPGVGRNLSSVTGLITRAKAGHLSFAEYFRRYPADVAPEAWMLARGFVEGFEAASVGKISAQSLAGETVDEHQYEVPGGYDQVVSKLVDNCALGGVRMLTEMVVRSVRWRRGRVTVGAHDTISGAAREYRARCAVIALPLGVLKARTGIGAMRFNPPLRRRQAIIDAMQMGHVARLAFRFDLRTWRRLLPRVLARQRPPGFGFLHSSVTAVPVWWSTTDQPIVVGWAGGPAALKLLRLSPSSRRRKALASLAAVLGASVSTLKTGLRDVQAWDWTHDPFCRGAYSFIAAGQDKSGAKLRRAVQGTLYFAGEATAEGAEVGTVHGAMRSGIWAAREAIRGMRGRRRR
jgi:monoamine oxidase